jgi:hypothetical protein
MMIVDYQHSNLQWKILHTNPISGALIDTEIHDGFGATLDVDYASDGTSVILTGSQPLDGGEFGKSYVLMGDESFAIGDGPIAFDVSPVNNVAVCACGGGGPDYISIVSLNNDAFPNILVDQEMIDMQADSGEMVSENLLISNIGSGPLNYDIVIDYGKSTLENWLSLVIDNGTINPGFDQIILLSANTEGLSIGEYTAQLQINSNDPDDPELIIQVHLDVLNPVGIDQLVNEAVIIGPVPTHSLLYITNNASVISYKIYSTTGEQLMEKKVGRGDFTIDFQVFPKGSYLIEFNKDGKKYYEKVINK